MGKDRELIFEELELVDRIKIYMKILTNKIVLCIDLRESLRG